MRGTTLSPSPWLVPSVFPAKRFIDFEQHLLLPFTDRRIGKQGIPDRAVWPLFEITGPDVQHLRRHPQCLGDLREYLGGWITQSALDLAEVRITHSRKGGELT